MDARLLTVIENVFTYNGKLGHEIIFLYRGDLEEQDTYLKTRLPILDKEGHFAEWISLEGIKMHDIKILPSGIAAFV